MMGPSFSAALQDLLEHMAHLFLLELARAAALATTFPLFGGASVPMRARAFLAVGIALVVLPLHGSYSVPAAATLVDLAIQLAGETLVGLTLGLTLSVLFAGIQIAGQIISQMAGLSIAEVLNPSFEDNAPVYSLFFYLLATTVFLTLDGHVKALESLLETFHAVPPGGVWSAAGGAAWEGCCRALLETAGRGFVLGVRAASPAIAALLVATVVLGLISRTMPQFNVFALGFGMNGLITLGALLFTLGAAVWVFQEEVPPALTRVLAGLRGAAP